MDATDTRTGVYAARRARLAAQMKHGVAVLATAPERMRNRDAAYPYRFDSYFYYLTGSPSRKPCWC
jgi:Xaa-Pro aminopeptidase